MSAAGLVGPRAHHNQRQTQRQTAPDIIARTSGSIIFRKAQPAFALLDYDTKGMPPTVKAEWTARRLLASARNRAPRHYEIARVIPRSTSAGLYRGDTGERLSGSDGLHVYVAVQDGTDIERFLKALHERCWLAGFGWLMVGAGGQLLERSIVDRMVGAPERLVFEGGPILDPPVQQEKRVVGPFQSMEMYSIRCGRARR